jgi:hypothetical protein
MQNNMDSEFTLTKKDLETIGEQIARMWLITDGFKSGYISIKKDRGNDDDEEYLEDISTIRTRNNFATF